MSGQDLMIDLQGKMQTLDIALKQIKKRGNDYAEAERDYKTALSAKLLEEKANGLAVSILADVCRGKPDIANLKMKRDIAEAMYKAALEAVAVYKLQIRILESQIDREYKG